MTNGPDELRRRLRSLDGRDYGAYQSLRGRWELPGFDLDVDLVPQDPWAPPGTGVCRVLLPVDATNLLPDDLADGARRIAVRDLLTRRFHEAAGRHGGGRRGTGWSGVITIGEPGQAILDRNAVVVDDGMVEARVFTGLGARSRSIDADLTVAMLLDELPAIVAASLTGVDRAVLQRHVAVVEDARALRDALGPNGLVAFLADESVLPRASGADDRPLGEGAVALTAPDSLRVTLDTPHAGPISGLGIPTGVTVLVGGGYHGKSTLLDTIATGIHDHVPDDGRERCVSRRATAVVRASPGRAVAGVDISAFVDGLPDGRSTRGFVTRNASGSTSQAAAISEALEMGAEVLLLDEDTSANNLLVRDARMQQLVARDDEPITVMLDRVRELDQLGVSTVVAVGGAGDWLDVADRVVQLRSYVPVDVSAAAARIATATPSPREHDPRGRLTSPAGRIPAAGSLSTQNRHGKRTVRAVARDRLLLGAQEVDLRDVATQLREPAQAATLALALEWLAARFDGVTTIATAIAELTRELEAHGLDALDDRRRGTLAAVRPYDIAAALNRVRTLVVDGPTTASTGQAGDSPATGPATDRRDR